MARRISRKAVDFVAAWEGFRPCAYWDVGRYSIGYGTEAKYGADTPCVSESTARRALSRELKRVAEEVRRLIRPTLNRDQLAALTSFTYNVGTGNLERSTLRRRLNAGEPKWRVIKEELPRWVDPGSGFEEGLRKRRAAEVNVARGNYGGSP